MGSVLKLPNKSVAQHNDLINALFDVPIVHLRAYLYAISHINFESKALPGNIYIPTEAVFLSKGGKNYKDIKKMIGSLQRVRFLVEETHKDKHGNKKILHVYKVLMPTMWWDPEYNCIGAKLHDDLKPYLLNLGEVGNFTQANLEELLKLKTTKAYRFYMFMKEYQDKKDYIEKRDNVILPDYFTISYLELRVKLGLDTLIDLNEPITPDNIKVEKYPLYADFRKFILEKTQDELADTQYAFDVKPIKDGRNVVKLEFSPAAKVKTTVKENKPEKKVKKASTPKFDPSSLDENHVRAYNMMIDCKLTEKQALYYLNKVYWNDITKKCYALKNAARDNKIKSLPAAVVEALKHLVEGTPTMFE